jgi:hypothetical protein
MIKGIIVITVVIIWLLVETHALDSVIEAVYPIVSPFPLGFLGLWLIGVAVPLLTVFKLVNRVK